MNWTDIDGFWEDYDREEYARLVSRIPDESVMVEVGVFRGRSLASIAPLLIQKKIDLVAIDIFGSVDYNEDLVTPKNPGMLRDFVQNMKVFGLDPLVICGTSARVADFMFWKQPSLVFIDGDHSYEAVKADIKTWIQVVKNGAILAGHDYGPHAPGVKQAVDELLVPWDLTVDHVIWSIRV